MSEVTALRPEKSSLAESVHARVRADIHEFRMMPGDRHSESELATRYGVSRTPLRLALHMLAREGYLNKGDGHAAWQVPPFDLDYFQDLYDLRVNLELIAVRRICNADPFPDFAEQREFWMVPEERRNLDGAAVAAADEALHAGFVANAGNAEMMRMRSVMSRCTRTISALPALATKPACNASSAAATATPSRLRRSSGTIQNSRCSAKSGNGSALQMRRTAISSRLTRRS